MKSIFTNPERIKVTVVMAASFLAIFLGLALVFSPEPVNTLPGEGSSNVSSTDASNPFNGFKGFTIVPGTGKMWRVYR